MSLRDSYSDDPSGGDGAGRARLSRARAFWDRFADRYAARQIKDVAAYEAMLAEAAGRLRPEDHVLELGCGTGGMAIRLAQGVAQYEATDFSARMIAIARAKPAPAHLLFRAETAEGAALRGRYDAICAFNLLHLVDDMEALLAQCHDQLVPGGLLISKTWCFADLPRPFRLLFGLLRGLGLFPPVRALRGPALRQAIRDAGFVILTDQVFGARPQNPYIVAQKPLHSA